MADGDRGDFAYDPEEVSDSGDDGGETQTQSQTEPEDEDTWRFSLDEVGEDGTTRPPIEAGSPEAENVLFVVLGAVATVLVFVRLALLVT
jgi:general stress protein YciG